MLPNSPLSIVDTPPRLTAPAPLAPLVAEPAAGDAAAIDLWLASRAGPDARAGAATERPDHTARTYRREAERFRLWLQTERGRRLAQATLTDAVAYRDFLADPAPRERWCAPRGTPRTSAAWRPFEGPLSLGARRQAIVVLGNLYRFLQDQRVLAGNPWASVRVPRHAAPRIETGRRLTRGQWGAVEAVLARLPRTHDEKQTAWIARVLHATGLRLAELVDADCDALDWMAWDDAAPRPTDALEPGGWVLRVTGKGLRERAVPVPAALVDNLLDLLRARDWVADPQANPGRPLLVAPPRRGHAVQRLSPRGVYRRLKAVFSVAANALQADGRARDAAHLRQASTHWLRHTFGSEAVAAGVPLDVVRENLGHASLATTSVYLHATLSRRMRELARMTEPGAMRPER